MNPEKIKALNDFAGIFGYKSTQPWKWMLQSPCKTTALFCGNRFGKGESVVMDSLLRVWGKHPRKHKNVLQGDRHRTFRICCETLPNDKEGEEVRNTIYPVLKRRIPPSWIRKDITARSPVMRVMCPLNPGKEINFEFVSYGQEVQSQAGVDRRLIIQDEESGRDFYEEQVARTMTCGGDVLVAFTPVPGSIGWMYDEIYDKARVIYRTPLVRERWKLRFGEDVPEIEITNSKDDICVIMAATDDNPIFEDVAKEIGDREGKSLTSKEYLDDFFNSRYADEDVIDARRYGLFRQMSGRVYKTFNERVHRIEGQHYFPMGVPAEWRHFRGMDYHQHKPWAAVWVALSPANELFVYRDASYQVGRLTTYTIAKENAEVSGHQVFKKNLIDPLANTTQSNTNKTTVDDLNVAFRLLKDQGVGSGGRWEPWDTKGTRGYEEFCKRLVNSVRVGRPFANEVEEYGKKTQLPTIWFLDDCKHTIESMRSWRWEQWQSRQSLTTKDEKEKREDKWSHFPITIECILKDAACRPAMQFAPTPQREAPKYFQARG